MCGKIPLIKTQTAEGNQALEQQQQFQTTPESPWPVKLLDQQQVTILQQQTQRWVLEASRISGQQIAEIPVLLNLRGSAAGQYRGGDNPCIRYNPTIAAQAFEEFVARTIRHEVAHYVVDCLYPRHRTKPHGNEWKTWMQAFGLEPSVCHSYDLSQVPVRRQRRFTYVCKCREHTLSATRHNRVINSGTSYLCRHCGGPLKPR